MTTREQSNRPTTIKAYLREAGIQPSGSIRSAISRALEDALLSLWENACNMYDGDTAAVLLFAVISRDPSFRVPYWVQLRLRAHRAAVIEAHDSGALNHIYNALEAW